MVLRTLLLLLLSADASADRLFSTDRAIRIDAVEGAERYEWQAQVGDGPWVPLAVATSTPITNVQAAWDVPTRYRVRAIAPPIYSEWSEPSEVAKWLPNGVPPGQIYGLRQFGFSVQVFGLTNCNGEWLSGTCSCAQGGPCPPP